MRGRGGKRPGKLPEVNERSLSYALNSINVAARGCYDGKGRLELDEDFGDYSMRLFRLKDRRTYVKTVPSAFTPAIRRLLHYAPDNPQEQRIATEHNDQIDRILAQPKEIYIQRIRQEREAEQQRRAEEQRRREFIKGEDRELREHNEQLSFNYLPTHQKDQWFSVLDRSPSYAPPTPPSFNTTTISIAATPIKHRRKRGHIFLSDNKSYSQAKRT